MSFKNRPPLRIATDFSGIDAPIEAIEQLGIPYEYLWGSEINKACREYIMETSPPNVLYGDVRERKVSSLKSHGKVDLYVAGFPCQSYSRLKRRAKGKTGISVQMRCVMLRFLLPRAVRASRLNSPNSTLLQSFPQSCFFK